MRVNAANYIEATAHAGGNGRIQLRVGVHRFTATPEEAVEFACQIVAAVDELNGRGG